ncbi:hypothetical protein E2C01_100989 [Portunus trituberculatus]|uniref:Uncharacterized protein n=1 Tax=Portunus trituberculatus TaxID=210409 RepID=A0A5B7KEZ6_PORTR|nr:hypothetical protein [Portunus trituberculatus]
MDTRWRTRQVSRQVREGRWADWAQVRAGWLAGWLAGWQAGGVRAGGGGTGIGRQPFSTFHTNSELFSTNIELSVPCQSGEPPPPPGDKGASSRVPRKTLRHVKRLSVPGTVNCD